MGAPAVQTGTREGLALDASTLCAAFQATAANHAERAALRNVGASAEISWREYAQRVRAVAGGLAAAGVARGETVAMMLANRPETVIIDTAAMHLGAIPFSIYNTSSPEQIEYLFTHARCSVVVTEAQFANDVLAVAARVSNIEHVFVFDGDFVGARPAVELETTPSPPGFDFEAGWRAVRGEDVATLIYTSGTTGPPKAVELTHANLLCQVRMLDELFPLRPAGRGVSYLPMAHLADRCASHYSPLVAGTVITFVAELPQVFQALTETRPTTWGAVPRVWEKLKAALEAGFAADSEERRAAIGAALEVATAVVRCEQKGEQPDAALLAARQRGEQELFAELRERLGLDQVESLISGAAPIAPEVLEFFAALGMPICEVWGMTETSLIATINPPEQIRIGTVGKPLTGVELKLAEDGELLVRGPTIMRGYRHDPERTAEAIDVEGWMHTGDIATIDDEGYVRIVDRKKELIINAGGKNMSPSNIENKLKAACGLIGSAVAIGDRRPYNTALIVLDPVAAASFAAGHGLELVDPAALAAEPLVRAEIEAGVERANAGLARVEQIKRHTLLPEEWQPGGAELTPTMKLKRRPIAEKYAAQIEAMYA